MIQRIQSIYLLAVSILAIVSMCLPVGFFIGADNSLTEFTNLSIVSADGAVSHAPWALFAILLLVVLIAGGIVVWGCEMMRMGLFCIIPVPMSCHGLVRSVAASIVLAPVYPSFNIHELRISRKYGMNNVMG